MPFEIEPITSAPSSADQTEPRPPNRLVPAITGPAIASSSRSLPPEPWFTASSREACMMPPIAAIDPAIANTITRIACTLIPARRAASALPPTAIDVPAEARAPRDVLHAGHEADQDQHRQRHAAVGVQDRDRRDHGGRDHDDPDQRPGELPVGEAGRHALAPRPEARRGIGADRDQGHGPADRIRVEGVREAGDLAVVMLIVPVSPST